MIRQQNGFTLVELAIALMVIGLLIGGVLKGQELIENARITRTVKDIHDVDTAVTIFRSIYNDELPGDMLDPSRLPDCMDMPCNNPNYVRGNKSIAGHARSANFWRHLNQANLISNIHESATNPDNFDMISPRNGFDAHLTAYRTLPGNPLADLNIHLNRIFIMDILSNGNIPNRLKALNAKKLDIKMDDGKPLSGAMQVQDPSTPTWNGNKCYEDDTLEYIHNITLRCSASIALDSLN